MTAFEPALPSGLIMLLIVKLSFEIKFTFGY